ncbi:MAG: hypothetical protein IKN64_11520 [Desulfovibrio sp.]|nr:hypothetical protein [Desulfovibrio sp.]
MSEFIRNLFCEEFRELEEQIRIDVEEKYKKGFKEGFIKSFKETLRHECESRDAQA